MLTTPKTKGGLFLASSLCDGLEDNDIKQVTTLLLNKEADPNVLIPSHGITPFHLVIGNDSEAFAEEVTKLFLRHGGNPNVRSVDGLTPVHVAAAWGRTGILELLLANGGDPLRLDEEGRSPFHYAFDGKYYRAISVLGKYCEDSTSEDESPKYTMSLDKVIWNHGDQLAEYTVQKKTDIDNKFDDKKLDNCCDRLTNSSLINHEQITLRRHQKFKSSESEKETSPELNVNFGKLRIDDITEKEKLLVSKIINHLSTSLSTDSTNETLINNVKRYKREKFKSSAADDTGISYNAPKSNYQNNEYNIEKYGSYTTKIRRKRSLIPRFKRKALMTECNKSPSFSISNHLKQYISSDSRNMHKDRMPCTLDNSIISKSPNFLSSLNLHKESNTMSHIKNYTPPKIYRQTLRESAFTPPTVKGKQAAQSTPRRKLKRFNKPGNSSKFCTPYGEMNESINYREIKSCKKETFEKVEHRSNSDRSFNTSNDSVTSDSPENECIERRNRPYLNNHLAVKLHEGKYDEDTEVTPHKNTNSFKPINNGSKFTQKSEECLNLENHCKYNNIQNDFLSMKLKTEEVPSDKINNNEMCIKSENNQSPISKRDVSKLHETSKTSWCNEKLQDSSINKFPKDDDLLSAIAIAPIKYARSSCTSLEHQENVTRTNSSYFSILEEYKYEDPEEGIVLLERRLCITPSVSDKNEMNSVQSHESNNLDSFNLAPLLNELQNLDDNVIRRKLTQLGYVPGPLTNTTKHIYIKRLAISLYKKNAESLEQQHLSNEERRSIKFNSSLLHENWIKNENVYRSLEYNAFHEFISPEQCRRWREGTSKKSFNYLLLDPRVTQDLPNCGLQFSEMWKVFLSAIFYIGKGKRTRPYQHLYNAAKIWRSGERNPQNKKIKHILDIWNADHGVVCLHVFQNTIPVEAYTREALMINAIGLKHLDNSKTGDYYGIVATWNIKDKYKLGRYLLYKTFCILLNEGERQLFPEDM